jgi:hypothetical protein
MQVLLRKLCQEVRVFFFVREERMKNRRRLIYLPVVIRDDMGEREREREKERCV